MGHVNDGPTATKKYVWNGSRLMAEIGPEYSFYFNYNAIGEMIGFMCRVEDDGTGSSAETQYIFVKNQQGDVEKVIRSWDQTIVASYAYDAWGNPLEWSGPMAERNPIRYRGYYYDTETGFYYLQSRYYDPQTGRFINADDASNLGANSDFANTNLFAYCGNNPVNREDDGGEFWNVVIGAAAGGLISAATTAFESYVKTGSVNWTNVVISGVVGAVNGGIAATGLGVITQASLTAATSALGAGITETVKITKAGGNFFSYDSVTRIAKKSVVSGIIGFGGSILGSGAGKVLSRNIEGVGNEMIKKGVYQASYITKRQAANYITSGKAMINTARGINSVVGTVFMWPTTTALLDTFA